VVCFILGIFWKRANRHGAFYTLAIGIPLGIIGFFSNEIYGLMDIHFLYACFVLLLINGAVMLLVSLNSEAPDPEVVKNYTWNVKMYREETIELKKLPLWQNYRVQSMVLLVLTAIIVGYFW
jgi:SSS family solute:Na+ symporter